MVRPRFRLNAHLHVCGLIDKDKTLWRLGEATKMASEPAAGLRAIPLRCKGKVPADVRWLLPESSAEMIQDFGAWLRTDRIDSAWLPIQANKKTSNDSPTERCSYRSLMKADTSPNQRELSIFLPSDSVSSIRSDEFAQTETV